MTDLMESDMQYMRPKNVKQEIISSFANYPTALIAKYVYYLRKQEYYINTAKGNKWKGLLGILYERKKNKLGSRLGFEIGPNCFGKGLIIYHIGSIIVNPKARIGENCKLHGANCIGNNGMTEGVPYIGNNVDIGYGAVIIGDVRIADNTIIGANAVVNKSVLSPGCTVAGVPARIVKKNMELEL